MIPAFVEIKKTLTGEPKPEGDRSVFAYSNINYYLLALLIEKFTGMPYGSYIKKFLFSSFRHGKLQLFRVLFWNRTRSSAQNIGTGMFIPDLPERIDTVTDNKYIFHDLQF